jgi:hypothetical protein
MQVTEVAALKTLSRTPVQEEHQSLIGRSAGLC